MKDKSRFNLNRIENVYIRRMVMIPFTAVIVLAFTFAVIATVIRGAIKGAVDGAIYNLELTLDSIQSMKKAISNCWSAQN